MSRRVSRHLDVSGSVAACVLLLQWSPVGAQTIADYSRVQRAMLESTMTQAAARSAGLGAPTPAASQAVAAAPAVAPVATPAARPAMPAVAPIVQVSGVFSARDGAIAEVVVNATPYLLGIGQDVPGTTWRVEAVDVERVVLGRRGAAGNAVEGDAARKVFPLAALPTPR